MKYYYYLLFRIFNSLSDSRKKNDVKTINILLTSTSSLIIWLVIYTILNYIDYYFYKISNKILPNIITVLAFLFVIVVLNYKFFVKPKNFLNYGFKVDKKGGYAIISFLVILALSFVIIANKKRDEIFKERKTELASMKKNIDKSQ